MVLGGSTGTRETEGEVGPPPGPTFYELESSRFLKVLTYVTSLFRLSIPGLLLRSSIKYLGFLSSNPNTLERTKVLIKARRGRVQG